MEKFTITHELRGAAPEAWVLLLDDEFVGEVYRQDLGYRQWAVSERTEDSGKTTRKVLMTPNRSMPGPVAKVFGSDYQESEHSVFSPSARVWQWNRVSSTMADKLRQEGLVRIEEAGAGSRMVIQTVIEAKIFGVGPQVESTFKKAYREEADTFAVSLSKRLAAAQG
ncbi:DUF2505 family protein [Streptomyces lateritius]|uniref:DUF2505 family protein n=1 Tax=Streptomyces lateritius TaxID=67313 RepID=UPI0016737784|nr:DUF2505 family protein [Streptomyces lateritius]GGU10759.1 hypothetical protein GCM10010272_64660 [Streptomyces lateritius]